MLVGAKTALDTGYRDATGGANGYSLIIDSTPLFGADQYRYPQNLPIVGAKGGPGGKPGCGSLPDVAANWPLRQLITNTGWGTGLDIRPNPGIAFPGYADYLPGHPGDSRTAQHPLPGRPRARADPVPGGAAVRRAAIRPGRDTAVPGSAAGATAGRAARTRFPATGIRAGRDPGPGAAAAHPRTATALTTSRLTYATRSHHEREPAGRHLAPGRLHGRVHPGTGSPCWRSSPSCGSATNYRIRRGSATCPGSRPATSSASRASRSARSARSRSRTTAPRWSSSAPTTRWC